MSTIERAARDGRRGTERARRTTDLHGSAASQSRPQRLIANLEAGYPWIDTRFSVTDPADRSKAFQEKVDCRRGSAENHVEGWRTHLAVERTCCVGTVADQLRPSRHAEPHRLPWAPRIVMPKRFHQHVAQPYSLRLRLTNVAARFAELRAWIPSHLPMASRAEAVRRHVVGRIPRVAM